MSTNILTKCILNYFKLKLLTCEAKVVWLLKIWWSFLNYLEIITIGIKPTLMKIKRF